MKHFLVAREQQIVTILEGMREEQLGGPFALQD